MRKTITVAQLATELVEEFHREEYGDGEFYTPTELMGFVESCFEELYPGRSRFGVGERGIVQRSVIRLLLWKGINRRRRTATPSSDPDRGSLQNIVAFQNALAVAVRARESLLNQRNPLTYEAAVDWLQEEVDEVNRLVDVSISVRIPVDVFREIDWGSVMRGRHEGLFQTLHRTATKYWGGSFAKSSVFTADGQRIALGNGRLIELREYALQIERWCGGFEQGVWFILTGFWWRRGVIASPRVGSDSRIVLDVGELETTPRQVSDFFADIRSKIGYGRKGQKLSRRVEVLTRIALEVEYVDRVDTTDRQFHTRVWERWRERASDHGLDPNAYAHPDSVRRVLHRVKTAIANRPDSISRPSELLAEWLKPSETIVTGGSQ